MINYNIQRSSVVLATLAAEFTGVMAQGDRNLDVQRNGNRPNIVLVIAEDLSPRWGCYGDKVANTPNIDALAQEGVRFTNVHTLAGVSGPSRSGLITGVPQNFTNLLHMRSMNFSGGAFFSVPPAHIKAYPELLRRNGYFTYADVKFDYQWTTPFGPGAFSIYNKVEENGYMDKTLAAHRLMPRWREYNLKGRPFFFNYNPQITHESGLFFSNDSELPKPMVSGAQRWDQLRAMYANRIKPTDPKKVNVKPFFMDTPESRKEIARDYDNIQVMDCQVGDLIKNLKEDGLWDNTIFILTTDHGDCLPRSKRDIYDSGTRVPMIIHVPDKYRPAWMGKNGSVSDRLISFEDIPPTLLSFSGAKVPDYMMGVDLSQNNPPMREYIYVNRGRQEKAEWHSYGIQDLHFQYIRNMTKDPNGKELAYRNVLQTVKDLNKAHKEGKLPPGMESWYEERPLEEFYDLDKDPYEFHNIINDPKYAKEIDRFRKALEQFRDRGNDATIIPEGTMRETMVNSDGSQKTTLKPIVTQDEINHKVYISTLTEGASIGYSFDGKEYELYTKAFDVPVGIKKVFVKAIRYGYKESEPVVLDIQ